MTKFINIKTILTILNVLFVMFTAISQSVEISYDTIFNEEYNSYFYGTSIDGEKIGVWYNKSYESSEYTEFIFYDKEKAVYKYFNEEGQLLLLGSYNVIKNDSLERYIANGYEINFDTMFNSVIVPINVKLYDNGEKKHGYGFYNNFWNIPTIKALFSWDNNRKKYTTYHRNGNVSCSENWKFQNANGIWKCYYEDGSIKSVKKFKVVKYNSLTKLMYGLNKKELNQYHSIKKGKWDFYNEDGTVKKTEKYRKGIIK